MQAPRQELFMLNWEVSDLTKKLQTFASIYSKIDLTTVDCLSQLLDTVDTILTKASVTRCSDWDAADEQIFNGYVFHHSINCKQCGRAVKTTRPSLVKHLKEHKNDGKSAPKIKTLNDVDLVSALEHMRLNDRVTSSLSGSTKLVDRKSNGPNKAKDDIVERVLDHIHGSGDATQVHKTKKHPTDSLQKSNKDTVVSKPNDNVVLPKQDKLSRSSSVSTTVSSQQSASAKPEKPKSKPTTKTTTKPANKNPQERNEPKRKVHVPNRAKDGEYTTVGSIPNAKVELNKKTRHFIVNVTPKTRFMVHASRRKEVTDSPAHREIVESLESTAHKYYPEAKAYLFGSRVTGLGNECSDLDIYLDLEHNYDGSLKYSKEKLKWFVQFAEEALELTGEWSKMDPVTAARTPILRAWNTKYKIDCDISFTHGLSHSNTRLIEYLFELQPVCYYVALYVKEWSHSFSMPGLNTYTIILLTIFYFQKHNLLPSIYSLQKGCEKPYLVSHWQANFERKSLDELKIPRIPEEQMQTHMTDFFAFYGSRFCFETRVVCPFLGWAPQKEDFDPQDCEIPLEMETLQQYYNKLDMATAHRVNDLLSYMKPMVVQDPLELNHNVAKGISASDVNRFRKFCAHTAALLDEVVNETS